MIENRKPTDDEARIILIGAWLAKFNDLYSTYGKGLETRPTLFDSFDQALCDLSAQQLEGAFNEWLRVGTEFPTPGDIRALITKHEEAVDQYDAEKAWEHVRWLVSFFCWSPDTGFNQLCVSKEAQMSPRLEECTTKTEFNGGYLLKPKPFDDRTEYAVRQVGGLHRITFLPAGSEFDFVRRGFLQAHRRFSETSGLTQLGRHEAKGLLENLQKGLPSGEPT